MSEHTPGPWQIRAHADGYAYVSAGDWLDFAKVVIRFEDDDSDNPVAVANARLIVAAPDLMTVAARWAMAMWQSGIAPVENSDSPLAAILFDTQAALFKATGRDVVADNLEALTAGNRVAVAKAKP